MGVLLNNPFGKIRGSIGPNTFQNWRGVQTVRSRPTDVANPNTEAQQYQRNYFSKLTALSRVVATIFNIGLAKQAIKKTAYNVFMALNNASLTVIHDGTNFLLDLSKLIVSKGSSPKISEVLAEIDNQSVACAINGILGAEPPADSKVYISVIRDNGDGSATLLGFTEGDFSDSSYTVACSATPNASTDVAVFFYVHSGTLQPCDSFVSALTT